MSVRRRGNRWLVDIKYQHPDGRVERIRKSQRTKRDAEQYERRVRNELAAGTWRRQKAEVPTLTKFSEEFTDSYVKANNKPSERMAKEYIFRLHLIPELGSKRLDRITVRDVEKFKASRLDRGLAPKSINNMLTVLGRCLRYAAELEIVESVPRIQFLKVAPPQIDFLDFAELDRLIEAARAEPEAFAAVLCGADAGMRAGEIRALQWDDIDFVARQITIQRTDYRGHMGSPKAGRLRVVPMTARLGTALKAIRHLKGPFVFCNAEGELWSRGEIDVRLWRGCRRAKLRKIGWHCTRHTFCSHLAMKGAPARAIQELAGHASLQTTQRYMHLSPAASREAIDLLESPQGHNRGTVDLSEEKEAGSQ